MIKKRAKYVRLDTEMIDDIWDCYLKIKDSSSSKDAACNRIAPFIGCSASTVYRVVIACEDAEAGKYLVHDPNKYPNAMMVDYINSKFAQPEMVAIDQTEESESSDIKLLAESIKVLAAAIESLSKK